MAAIRFHLAFPVRDIEEARDWYCRGLGCRAGRSNDQSLILELGGHQIVAHRSHEPIPHQKGIYPRHFGLVFEDETKFQQLLQRAEDQGLAFRQPHRRRFEGTPLEHRTFFLEDPSGNLLEFKYYAHPEAVFGATEHALVGDRQP
jgi:uncharacterized protein